NPTDSANIVVSPIRQDFSNSVISCPVYYTNDFGNTWAESSFLNMPHVSGQMSGGGGDPVFAYDKNGRLYFSWIDLYGTSGSFMYGTVNMGIFWAYSDDGGASWIQPVHDTILLGQMQMIMGFPISVISPISDKQWMAVDMTDGAHQNNLYISYVTISGTNTYQIKCKTKPAGIDQFTTEAVVTDPADFTLVQFSSVCVDNAGNVHIVFYGVDNSSNTSLWHSVSTDGGVSFSTPNKISDIRFNLPMAQITPYDLISGIKDDRLYPSPYMDADPVSPNIYVTWTAFGIDSDLGNGADIYFSRSVDNGAVWSTPIIVNDDATGTGIHNYYSSIYVKPNGDVKVSWYDRRNDLSGNINTHYYYATSEDGGLSFGTNYPGSNVATDFSTVGTNNQDFGIGEYTQVLASDNYTIPVWCDGRENNGNLNVFIAFIDDNSVGSERVMNVNSKLYVSNTFPNPAVSDIQVDFSIPGDALINLEILDGSGRYIKTIAKGYFYEGTNRVRADISGLSSGHYYIRLQSEGKFVARKFSVY
ncbi:MAG: T9SS type A sorting domain-containing protein, partial [Bacteroidota bacterium]